MKSMNEYLQMDGAIAFNIAIFNRFSSIGDGSYSDICGSFVEGVYQWYDHNISYIVESENSKYVGWTIYTNCGSSRRVYIPKWVMNIKPKDWKHAKALFNKYLQQDTKFNNSEMANQPSY